MENLLLDLKAHNLQNRMAAVIENGSWGPQAGKLIREILSGSLCLVSKGCPKTCC